MICYLLINSSVNSEQKKFFIQELEQQRQIDKFKRKIEQKKYNVSCRKIFEMNVQEIGRAKNKLSRMRQRKNKTKRLKLLPDANFIFNRSQCSLFRKIRGYNARFKYNSNHKIEFERNFPLAFSILTYDNVEQF